MWAILSVLTEMIHEDIVELLNSKYVFQEKK
jgi:hypothetical protein